MPPFEIEFTDLPKTGGACDLGKYIRVSVQGVESLWGDCRFIPADWGSQ